MSIYKDVNEFNQKKKLLKAEMIYWHHTCKYNCVKDIYNQSSESCFKACENGNFKWYLY